MFINIINTKNKLDYVRKNFASTGRLRIRRECDFVPLDNSRGMNKNSHAVTITDV